MATRMPMDRLIATLREMDRSWWLAIVLPRARYGLAISRAIEELEKVHSSAPAEPREP